jgi:hypothetical protein
VCFFTCYFAGEQFENIGFEWEVPKEEEQQEEELDVITETRV